MYVVLVVSSRVHEQERERDSLIHDDNGPNRADQSPPPSAAKESVRTLKNIHPFNIMGGNCMAWRGV